jgi:hypothetical protein
LRQNAGALIRQARAWWRDHRPASPATFDRELANALHRIAGVPHASKLYGHLVGAEVRYVFMPRSRYTLYFVIEPQEIVVVSLWHISRGELPTLG